METRQELCRGTREFPHTQNTWRTELMKFRQKALKEMKDRRSWKGHLDRRSWKKLKCVQRWPSPQQIISWMLDKRKHKSDTKLVLIPGLATVSSNNPQLKPYVPRQYLNPQIFNTKSCTKENGTEYLVTGNMQTEREISTQVCQVAIVPSKLV